MAKHVDITKWDKDKIGTAYMNAMVALELAERRLSSMTISDSISPETRFINHAAEIRELNNEIKKLTKDFKDFKAISFTHMDWMSTSIKWKEDLLHDSTEEGSQMQYSKQLVAALAFVDKLKEEL